MAEATWGDDAPNPTIDWRMSASLEDVPRGGGDVAEVTNLERAVRDWLALDEAHRSAATLTTEHAVQIEGAGGTSFVGDAIGALASRLPPDGGSE